MPDLSTDPAPAASLDDLLVRRATIGDRDAVWPLVQEIPGDEPDRAAYDRSFGPLVSALDTYLVVAEDPTEGLVGYLLANYHRTMAAGGTVVWVEEVAVLPDVRGRGVGRALVAAAETWSRSVGAVRMSLATPLSGDFYRALGYREDATYFTTDLD
ncbi:ribosomal protein S18 acetylase RimI-like enzyme [Sediminihabitans luteus]|uniref:Ribosomal protein S18 acetylase RimI-like enzyme n=1 Tax=Sediminihabitans luteus TaxID=1138585 RepID=A0A2M9CZK8_9CELL|nr:GNAT family N-acetyltransferase [Sediminihabitans luteus]PJJ77340.1 ribosomal protein S18 acetylase RimI-like enzyme [Sediminihabitans luteus]GII98791.1 hypothetical protein Slu03_11690 [Sediminihabitans luteus]